MQRQREAGTLTFRTVERGAIRGQAMTFTNVAVDEIPDTLDELARIDRDSSVEEITVTHEEGEVTVVFATGREQDGADLSAVSPFQHDLIVTVPGEVTQHNAKEVDGARLQWNQAAIAEPSVTYRPGPTLDRDPDSGAADGGEVEEASEGTFARRSRSSPSCSTGGRDDRCPNLRSSVASRRLLEATHRRGGTATR